MPAARSIAERLGECSAGMPQPCADNRCEAGTEPAKPGRAQTSGLELSKANRACGQGNPRGSRDETGERYRRTSERTRGPSVHPASSDTARKTRQAQPAEPQELHHPLNERDVMVLADVRDVCSPADANPGQPVPARVTVADRRSQTGVRVLGVWSWAGRTGVLVTWVNVGHSLPPQVSAQVARLCARAPVAQGIEHRFPKPCVAGSNPAGGTSKIRRRPFGGGDVTAPSVIRLEADHQ